jgi:lipoprotein-anchoring transpeptidase ErfK/SrfK
MWSLGKGASHGCARTSVTDVRRLSERVPVGAVVMIQ